MSDEKILRDMIDARTVKHTHNWIACEWSYKQKFGVRDTHWTESKVLKKLWCPDCETFKEVL